MEQMQALTLDGNRVSLKADIVAALKVSLQGQLLTPGNSAFEQSRKVWNGMIDRRPAIIIKCADSTDVIKAIKFAADYNLLVSVKAGGHNFGGLSVCEDGLMIDLSHMNHIEVDSEAKIARAQAGALLSDLDKATQVFGLATTSGTVSHTGIAGLSLGGGQGWMMNKYGLTCDNLLSVDIVTADGQLLTANKNQNADLFWAVRGGGGNFGVVTAFEYKLHNIGSVILGGMVIYPIDQVKEVLSFFREFSMNTPDELTVLAGMLCLPDGTPAIALAIGWMGEMEEGKRILQPLRDFGSPIADMVGEMPYVQLQSIFDAAVPYGMPRYGKMGYLPELSDDFIEVVIQHWHNRTSPYALVLFNTMKGAVTRVSAEATPFYHRKAQWHFDILSQWTEVGNEQEHIKWVRNFWDDTVAFTNGASINFLGPDDGQDRVRLSFGSNYERLVEIKSKYDPNNLFRLNSNIIPKSREKQPKETLVEK